MQTSDLLAAVDRVAEQVIGPAAPSVDRDAVDSFDAQAHRLRKGEKGMDREVAQVLVVDRVVLQSVEELADVRHFDNDGAPRPAKRTGASE